MRLATYNVAWFAELFDRDDQILADDEPSGHEGVSRARQLEALGIVFTAMDADAVMIVEAPNTGRRQDTVRALERFAAAFELRTRAVAMGFANETHQEIAMLYDPDRMTARHDPKGEITGKRGSRDAPRFDGVFRIDLDIDGTEDLVTFSKPPLELAVTTAKGTQLRILGAHLKSVAPYGEKTRDGVMRAAIANRRKQLAQAIWLRARIDAHLDRGESVIVMGDLNDGPGLDEFEALFGRSSVEVVLGDDMFDPHARLAVQRRPGALPTTARFRVPGREAYFEALLDYIMISRDLMSRRPEWRIWHPLNDERCRRIPELREALLDASDHFPVTLDVEI